MEGCLSLVLLIFTVIAFVIAMTAKRQAERIARQFEALQRQVDLWSAGPAAPEQTAAPATSAFSTATPLEVVTPPAPAPAPPEREVAIEAPAPLIVTEAIPTAAAAFEAIDEPPLIPPSLAPAKIDIYDVQGASMIERTDDGALIIDSKYTLKGSGTQVDPFVVPWDLLVSVQDDFDPGRSALRIPERVALLQDKWVRLEGYVSFPLMSNEPSELLAMLNMWDGCCIGVPPSPYDAVEVRLKRPVTGDDVYATGGSITGRFSVKPYVVKSWLVGMFMMDDAEFKVSEDGAGT